MTGLPSQTTVLELIGVSRTYPGSPPLTVLADVDLRVRAGELAAVVGPSGSGKSTMLSVLGTLDSPTTGTVRVGGIDTADLDETGLARLRAEFLGFVFQQFFLLPSLTATANVATGLLYAGVGRTERRDRAREVLTRVGLGHRLDHRPGQLSGGEQQRVAIARALVGNPRVLLADEPTGALDQRSGRMVVELLTEIAAGGTAVVLITHDRDLAAGMPRQVTLLDGRIVSDSAATAARDSGTLGVPR